jgi:hypothetical protein
MMKLKKNIISKIISYKTNSNQKNQDRIWQIKKMKENEIEKKISTS